MDTYFNTTFQPKRKRNSGGRGLNAQNTGFRCKRCGAHVHAEPFLSGVQNRNHCPYCLWSRHVDLYKPGDRLAACKGQMKPVGLTLKKTRKKYADTGRGELMLIHQCVDCAALSINRIAADDLADAIFEVFRASLVSGEELAARLAGCQIDPLTASDAPLVNARLFGWEEIYQPA